MRLFVIWALCSAALHAATVRGVVLDHFSGRPLARALVTLEPIPGSGGGGEASTRANSGGQFIFPPQSAGAYLVSASRPGFATFKYGQKAWNAPGVPIVLESDSAVYLDIRLRRLPAITGAIWDENEIGIPEQEVYAYKATRPPKLVTRARTDDRGVYRLGSLEPGQYFVRSGPKQLDETTGVLPTFFKQVAPVEEATVIEVDLEEQATDINFRPLFGKVCRISGKIEPPILAQISLISDMGPITTSSDGGGHFSFPEMAPGHYELLAEGNAYRSQMAAYRKFFVDNDVELLVDLRQLPALLIQFEEKEGNKLDPKAISVFARRKDLSGNGPPQKITGDRPTMLPGRWEIQIVPPPVLYPVSVTGAGHSDLSGERADGCNEISLPSSIPVRLRVVLSSKPAALRGKVIGSGNAPVMGAPVYLEAYDPNARKRLTELRSTLTDMRGEYEFAGLTPGPYRVLSTFEFEDPDERTMEAAHAKSVSLKEAIETVQDLDLYVRP